MKNAIRTNLPFINEVRTYKRVELKRIIEDAYNLKTGITREDARRILQGDQDRIELYLQTIRTNQEAGILPLAVQNTISPSAQGPSTLDFYTQATGNVDGNTNTVNLPMQLCLYPADAW